MAESEESQYGGLGRPLGSYSGLAPRGLPRTPLPGSLAGAGHGLPGPRGLPQGGLLRLQGQAGQTQSGGRRAPGFLWKGGWVPTQPSPGTALHAGTRRAPTPLATRSLTLAGVCAHTRGGAGRLWGLRQRLLCCGCPAVWGGDTPIWRGPLKEMAGGPPAEGARALPPPQGLWPPGPPDLASAQLAWLPTAPPPRST